MYTWTFKKDDNFDGLGDHYEETINTISHKRPQIENIEDVENNPDLVFGKSEKS